MHTHTDLHTLTHTHTDTHTHTHTNTDPHKQTLMHTNTDRHTRAHSSSRTKCIPGDAREGGVVAEQRGAVWCGGVGVELLLPTPHQLLAQREPKCSGLFTQASPRARA